ncbi:MAG: TetR/AcrR family transcriptional regulator [Oscillospiraceae bacterium]|nr:TetR/AcrR family transcriptional regulator [Oscillospiraceae bacterium]
MSFIDYAGMAETRDLRTVKTRRALHEALVLLMDGTQAGEISVKELCRRADINRSTFYLHFRGVHDVYMSWLRDMTDEYLLRMEREGIIGARRFDARRFILHTNELAERYPAEFRCLYRGRQDDDLFHVLGMKTGEMAKRLMLGQNAGVDDYYTFALVFTVSGLIISYIDWNDLGRQIPLEYLADLAEKLCASPIDSTINSMASDVSGDATPADARNDGG